MTTARNLSQSRNHFWTSHRLALTLLVLSLLAMSGLSGCTSNSPERATGGSVMPERAASSPSQPTVTVTRSTSTPATQPAPAASPAEPAVLPASLRDASLTDINGKSLKLSDYSGKVLIVNMWATWCGPCRQEMPELVQLHKDYKSKGLEVVGLATAQNDPDLEAVKDFIKEQKVDYKVVYDNGMLASALTQMTNARSVIPQNFIISRDGRIVGHFQGFSPIATPPKLRDAVEKALSESKG